MVKTEGWERRLAEVIESNLNTPFKWGQFDCSIFSLMCIDAQCETEIVNDVLGLYSNEDEAMALLESKGGYEQVLADYGIEEKAPAFASRGDIAFIDDHEAMGVVVGSNVLSTGKRGLVSLPLSKIKRLWGIKCHK